jgi:hypothetical protein
MLNANLLRLPSRLQPPRKKNQRENRNRLRSLTRNLKNSRSRNGNKTSLQLPARKKNMKTLKNLMRRSRPVFLLDSGGKGTHTRLLSNDANSTTLTKLTKMDQMTMRRRSWGILITQKRDWNSKPPNRKQVQRTIQSLPEFLGKKYFRSSSIRDRELCRTRPPTMTTNLQSRTQSLPESLGKQ